MDIRDQLIDAIVRNDTEQIRKLRLVANTVGIVATVDGHHYTANKQGTVYELTEDENNDIGNPIRVTCDRPTMELIFAI